MPHQDAALAGDGEDGGAERLPGHGGHVPLQAMLQRGDGGTAGEEGRVTRGKRGGIKSPHTAQRPVSQRPVSQRPVVGA